MWVEMMRYITVWSSTITGLILVYFSTNIVVAAVGVKLILVKHTHAKSKEKRNSKWWKMRNGFLWGVFPAAWDYMYCAQSEVNSRKENDNGEWVNESICFVSIFVIALHAWN